MCEDDFMLAPHFCLRITVLPPTEEGFIIMRGSQHLYLAAMSSESKHSLLEAGGKLAQLLRIGKLRKEQYSRGLAFMLPKQ